MVLPFLVLSSLVGASVGDGVMLERKFVPGTEDVYQVHGVLDREARQLDIDTFLPQRTEISYMCREGVQSVLDSGFARIRYKRYGLSESSDEDFEKGVQTVKLDESLTADVLVSPTNDWVRRFGRMKVKSAGGKSFASWAPGAVRQGDDDILSVAAVIVFGDLSLSIQRLALCIGSPETSLEFSPKFPFEPVKVGDSWYRTVGYQPQKLGAASNDYGQKRLDFRYEYGGPMAVNGKQIVRVTGHLNLDTDIATFLNQVFEGGERATKLKSLPLKLDMTIEYDLDPATLKTLRATARSAGSFSIHLSGRASKTLEERFKGLTTLSLVSSGPAKG